MTGDYEDSLLGEVVRRAHETDPDRAGVDVAAGLDDVRRRVRDAEPVVDRERVFELFGRLVRQPYTWGAPSPVLVIRASPGGGKTHLLTELTAQLDMVRRIPHAQIDFSSDTAESVPQVLLSLAIQLSAPARGRARLRFVRLLTAHLAMQVNVDQTDVVEAPRQLVAALEEARRLGAHQVDLWHTAAGTEAASHRVDSVTAPLTRAVQVLLSRTLGRKFALSRRGALRDVVGHSIDELLVLSRWAHSVDSDDRRRVDEMLCDAFLADLQDTVRRARKGRDRPLNWVVLLDNTDTPIGQAFLAELVEATRRRGASAPDEADPLAVVVTGRGTILQGANRGSTPELLRCRLSSLSKDEVDLMVSRSRMDAMRIATMVHEFTGGHPAATRLIVNAVDGRSDLADLVARVEEPLSRLLLNGLPAHVIEGLTTCAAARHQAQALWLVARDFATHVQPNDLELVAAEMWGAPGTTGYTVLRRLLLRRLAARGFEHMANWSTVHQWLRKGCRDEGDTAGELYHALAEGDFDFVAGQLAERFATDDAHSWVELLGLVTSAPNNHTHRRDAMATVEQLTIGATRQQGLSAHVARLVAAMWIASDPLSNGHRWLYADIADTFEWLASHSGAVEMRREAMSRRQMAASRRL